MLEDLVLNENIQSIFLYEAVYFRIVGKLEYSSHP